MKLHTIWMQEAGGSFYCLDAWDEYSLENNPSGYREALEKAYEERKRCEEGARVHEITFVVNEFAIREVMATAVIPGEVASTDDRHRDQGDQSEQ